MAARGGAALGIAADVRGAAGRPTLGNCSQFKVSTPATPALGMVANGSGIVDRIALATTDGCSIAASVRLQRLIGPGRKGIENGGDVGAEANGFRYAVGPRRAGRAAGVGCG